MVIVAYMFLYGYMISDHKKYFKNYKNKDKLNEKNIKELIKLNCKQLTFIDTSNKMDEII